MAKASPERGSRRGLLWATGAYVAGLVLLSTAIPRWVPLMATVFVLWRWLAELRQVWIPNTVIRSLLAMLLAIGVLAQFHTLNGLSAGSALLVIMGAIKLLETRTPRDQFIVIGAALFLLMAACLDRQSLLRTPLYLADAWLCCAALAVIAYERAPALADVPGVFDNRAAVVLAGRSLLLALPLALLLFLLFPRLTGAFWALPRNDEARTGLAESMSPGSIAQLTSSYEVAFRASFAGAPPPPQERYWRGPVLHEFDGYTWRRGTGSFYLPQKLEYLDQPYHYRIALEPSAQRWWFSLDTATGSPNSRVFFTYDYQLIAAEPVTEVTSYSLTSNTHTRSMGALSTLAWRHDTALPAEANPRSRALALRLHAESGSDTAFVAAVLEYLRTGGFKYSLTPPRLSRDSVDDFLFNTRVGFCGHYASAFVALMRAAGVPARVVTGYLGGEWNPIGGYFIVRQSDAHSWAEVWLDERGWVRVDPTAVVEPERLRRGILDLLPDAVSAPARFVWSTPWLAALLQRWDAINAWWNDRVVKFNYAQQLRILERLGIDSPGVRELAWGFACGLIAWLVWVAWQIGRLATPAARRDRLARAYTRLCRKLATVGLARESSEGPLDYAARICRARPELSGPVHGLILDYARLRYGPPAGESVEFLDRFERAIARLRLAPS